MQQKTGSSEKLGSWRLNKRLGAEKIWINCCFYFREVVKLIYFSKVLFFFCNFIYKVNFCGKKIIFHGADCSLLSIVLCFPGQSFLTCQIMLEFFRLTYMNCKLIIGIKIKSASFQIQRKIKPKLEVPSCNFKPTWHFFFLFQDLVLVCPHHRFFFHGAISGHLSSVVLSHDVRVQASRQNHMPSLVNKLGFRHSVRHLYSTELHRSTSKFRQLLGGICFLCPVGWQYLSKGNPTFR